MYYYFIVLYLALNWKTEIDESGSLKFPAPEIEPKGVVVTAP